VGIFLPKALLCIILFILIFETEDTNMAIHTALTERLVKYQVQARNSGTTLEDIIKKEYHVDEVGLSEMGGVWLYKGEDGHMMSVIELTELLQKLSEIF
jgi:hypothetical protein